MKEAKNLTHLVSFSGGKDSAALLLMMKERGLQVDEIVFFDTGWEWPEVYEVVVKVEELIHQKITWLKPDKSFEWYMYEKPCKIGKGKGWPRFNLRWCTGLKQDTTRSFMRDKRPYVNYLGITADEHYRIRKSHSNAAYPLVEWGITERECLRYCNKKGLDYGNLYRYMNSTSCWCCPLQPLNALRSLYRHFPDLWSKLLEMQKRTPTPFKCGENVQDGIFVQDLDARFTEELATGVLDSKLRKYRGAKSQSTLTEFTIKQEILIQAGARPGVRIADECH